MVNIITENRRQGFRATGRYGVTEQGDDNQYTGSLSWGTRFADRKGYFLISGTYDRRTGASSGDRDFSSEPVQWRYNSTLGINEFDTFFVDPGTSPTNANTPKSGFQPASTFPPNVFSDLSGNTPGGAFYGSSSGRRRFFDANGLVPLGPDVQTGAVVNVGTNDPGNSGYFLTNRDGFNLRDFRALAIPRTRYLLAAKLNYDLSDATTFFSSVQWSRIDTTEIREPIGLSASSTYNIIDQATGENQEITYGRIACRRATGSSAGPCSPFVPDELRADVSTNGNGVFWSRRFNEVGDRITTNRRDTLRSWAGFKGDAFDDWNWEASVGYGRFEQTQIRANAINAPRLVQAMNVELGPDSQPRCVDAAARADGCVPVNIFGLGSISAQGADWIRANVRQDLVVEQLTAQAFMTGTLFELPAGPVGAAFGIDFREDKQDLRGDELAQFGGTTTNIVPNFGGSIAAFEGFGEVSVPLVTDKPGARLLSLDLSARVAEYDIDNVGTVVSYRAGLQWAPVNDVRFRVQWARAQRAPDLTELFSPPRGDFDTVTDICSGVTPTSTGQIAVNCLAEPGIQALFAQQLADGDPQSFEPGTSTYSPNAGNSTLKEETADTLTAGVVVRPSFLPGLAITVDYYNIKITDAIDSFTNEDLLRLCYDAPQARADNSFCNEIRRNPNDGTISELVQREFNLSALKASGVDVSVDWRFGLDAIGAPGHLTLRYDANHLLTQKSIFPGLDGPEINDQRGELISNAFKYRARGSIDYEVGDFRIRWTAKYLGSILDSNQRLADFRVLQETLPDAEFPLFLKITDVWEHDINVRYDFNLRDKRKVRLFGGVNNLFDRVSPVLPTGTVSGRLTNINTSYDILGRRFYGGVRLDF